MVFCLLHSTVQIVSFTDPNVEGLLLLTSVRTDPMPMVDERFMKRRAKHSYPVLHTTQQLEKYRLTKQTFGDSLQLSVPQPSQ